MIRKCKSSAIHGVKLHNYALFAIIVALIVTIVGCTSRSQTADIPTTPTLQASNPSPTSGGTESATTTIGLLPSIKLLGSFEISVPHQYVAGQIFHPLDWSPDGKNLAYVWGDGVWIVESPEFKPRRVTSISGAQLGQAVYSPTGEYLAFSGNQLLQNHDYPGAFIWVVNSDGTHLKNITAKMQASPILKYVNQWVDNQTLALNVWGGSGAQTLSSVDIPSGEIKPLIDTQENITGTQAIGGEYYWSPKHDYIAIQNEFVTHVIVVPVNDLNNRRWISDPSTSPYQQFQAWLSNNSSFLYTEWNQGASSTLGIYNSSLSLWKWDVHKWQGQKLLDNISAAVPSPDGKYAAILVQEQHLWIPPNGSALHPLQAEGLALLTLRIMDLTSGVTINIGKSGYKAERSSETPILWENASPLWSPDGKWLAYWDNNGNIWIVSYDGQWRKRITNGLAIAQVLWSPDSDKLALRTMDHAWIIERPSN